MTSSNADGSDRSEADEGWIYVAPMNVRPKTRRLEIPNGLFEAGIVERGGEVYWAYETVTGVPVVSNTELEGREYESLSSPGSIYSSDAVQIPSEFFPPDDDAEPHEIAKKVDERAYIQRDQRRHFIYRVGMDRGETRSCYLLTDDQVQTRLSGPDDWSGHFDSKPQFF